MHEFQDKHPTMCDHLRKKEQVEPQGLIGRGRGRGREGWLFQMEDQRSLNVGFPPFMRHVPLVTFPLILGDMVPCRSACMSHRFVSA